MKEILVSLLWATMLGLALLAFITMFNDDEGKGGLPL